MNTQVKICGINSEAAFDAVVAAQADYLGFVFYPPSPRYVTPGQAAMLSARDKKGPRRVGLFVAPRIAEIAAVLAIVKLDILQIYADASQTAAISSAFSLPVWRQLGASVAADLPRGDEDVDGYLIEAKPPEGATRPGGNAVQADWALLSGWSAPKFWLLAGGLRPDNVAAALRRTGAPGVDVSSGVETALGVKDVSLIKSFVEMAKRGS